MHALARLKTSLQNSAKMTAKKTARMLFGVLIFSACVPETDVLEHDPWLIAIHGTSEFIDVPDLPPHIKLPKNRPAQPIEQWASFRALVYGNGHVHEGSKVCDQLKNETFICKIESNLWLEKNIFNWHINLHDLEPDLTQADSFEKIVLTVKLEGTEQNCIDYARAELRYRCATDCGLDKLTLFCPYECKTKPDFPELFFSCKYHNHDVFIVAESEMNFKTTGNGNPSVNLLFSTIEFTYPYQLSKFRSPAADAK